MKKTFIAFMAALLILPFFGSAVLAEEVVYKDGKYDVPFVIKDATNSETSVAQNFVDNPAKLTVENGKLNFQLTTASYLQALTVSGVKAELVNEGEKKDFAFTLKNDFTNPVTMDMHVVVPGMYDAPHTVHTTFDMSNVPVVEEEPVEEPTEPEVPTEEPVEEPTEPEEEEKPTNENKANASDANLVDSAEKFAANYVSDLDLARHFENPVTVVVKDGKHYIQINGSGAKYIDSLTVNGEEVTWGAIDAAGNYTAQFVVDSLANTQEFTMNLTTPMGAMAHTANIHFEAVEVDEEVEPELVDSAEKFTANYVSDINLSRNFENPVTVVVKDGKLYIQMNGSGANYIDSLTLNGEELILYHVDEAGNYTTQFVVDALEDTQEFTMNLTTPMGEMTHTANISFETLEEPVEPVEPVEPEEPVVTPEPTPEPEEPVKEEPKEEPKEEVNPLEADKAQTIDFVFRDETGQKVSAADSFFEKPAVLLEKDGVQYVQITTNGNEYIKSLSNRFGEFDYVGEDANGNHVYQFRVDGDITKEQVIDMSISVPGMYEMDHTTRLVLDANSLKEVDGANYELVASDSGNGPNADGKTVLDPNTPEKPVIADPVKDTVTNTTDANGDAETAATAGLNPKTGENTNLMLYVLLMLVSAVPIALQVKRRFA